MMSKIKCSHCNAAIPRKNIVRIQLSCKITCRKCGGKNKIPHLWLLVILTFMWFILIAISANYVSSLLKHNEGGVSRRTPYSSISSLIIFLVGYVAFLKGWLYFIKRAGPLIRVT